MTMPPDYRLTQPLPADVLVGGTSVLSRYRRYPVFGRRWLMGRSLLFCTIMAVDQFSAWLRRRLIGQQAFAHGKAS